jgi:hypothetical protein
MFSMRIYKDKSKEIIPSSGVPQGLVLGLLFFSIFINDIFNGLSSLKLLFADDVP